VPAMTSIAALLPAIAEAGQIAQHYYRRSERLGTRLKADRTVVTEADTAVEALLRQAIGDCFPGVNILGEEGGIVYDPQQPYTLVIDPIDGTLSFACGTPGWAICVGVLDSALQPVAGIISAPSWDGLFVADLDPHSPATYNGTPLAVAATPAPIDNNTTILIDSRFLQTHQVRGFPGKCRNFGSTALHMCLVAQQSGFALAHCCPVYIWDIAAAHAIVARVGLSVQYLDGQALTYGPLLTGQPTHGSLLTGHPAMLTALGPHLVPLAS
jgi:fructose-1,6-bisphosphatase/inositol monophosphatase family enzyme